MASGLSDAIPAPVATHALTVGAVGALTLGMMSRVALGHSGRLLEASRGSVAAFVLVTMAALVRVFAVLVAPDHYRATLVVSGTLWSLAFASYLAAFTPLLLSPRLDGKPG